MRTSQWPESNLFICIQFLAIRSFQLDKSLFWEKWLHRNFHLYCCWLCSQLQSHLTWHFVRTHSAIQWRVGVKAAWPLFLPHPFCIYSSFSFLSSLRLCTVSRYTRAAHSFYYAECRNEAQQKVHFDFYIKPPFFAAKPSLLLQLSASPSPSLPCVAVETDGVTIATVGPRKGW